MISVEASDEAIRVSIPRSEISAERLGQLLRALRLEAAVSGNQMDDALADELAEGMKNDWWLRNRLRFLEEGSNGGE